MQKLIDLALQQKPNQTPHIKPQHKLLLLAINNIGNNFTLSNEAMKYIKNEIDESIIINNDLNNHQLPEHITRDDPRLIKIIELLGQRADGFESNIVIKQYYLPHNCTFKINGSFGKEMVFSVPVNNFLS
jgi:hypothetical protein